MAGRTHLQHALPITFGYKCAIYLSAFQRNLERLDALLATRLLVQFGGAAGTLASLGPSGDDAGLAVRKNLATELELNEAAITWHVARDNIAEIISVLGIIGGSLGKIALDLMIMSSNELGEVSEPFVPHRGASSTMPLAASMPPPNSMARPGSRGRKPRVSPCPNQRRKMPIIETPAPGSRRSTGRRCRRAPGRVRAR